MGFFDFGRKKEPFYNQRSAEKKTQTMENTSSRPPAASSMANMTVAVDKQIAYGIDYLDERMNELTQAETGIAEYVRKMQETYAGIG